METPFIAFARAVQALFERGPVVFGNGEVQRRFFSGRYRDCFNQVLFEGGPHFLTITVKRQECFGQRRIAEPAVIEQVVENRSDVG